MKRRFVTLIELLLVMALVIVIGSIVGYNVNYALKEQRFKTEVSVVADTLRLAQDIMLILNTDVIVTFQTAKEGKGIKYGIEIEYEVSKEWKSFIQRSRRNLTAIRSVSFKDPRFDGDGSVIKIRFLSGGTVMSQGTFILSPSTNPHSKNTLNRYICLPGFPAPLTVVVSEKMCEMKDETQDLIRMSELTVQEIREYEKI